MKSSTKNCSDYETCKTNLENLKNNFQTVRKQPVQVDNIGKTIFYDHDYETFAKDILSETETFNVNSEDGITEMEIISDSNINDFGNIENENLNLNFIGDNENINQKSIEIDTDLLTPGILIFYLIMYL